jgi:hypothetical protein
MEIVNVKIEHIKEICKLNRKSIRELRKLNPHAAYNGKDLSKEELIYQIVFFRDAPLPKKAHHIGLGGLIERIFNRWTKWEIYSEDVPYTVRIFTSPIFGSREISKYDVLFDIYCKTNKFTGIKKYKNVKKIG